MYGDNGNTLFKFMLTLSFLTGSIAYLFAIVCCDDAAPAACFGVLLLLSLLCAAGISVVDDGLTMWLRGSTKTAMFFFSFSFNGGGLISEILLIRGMELPALICAVTACIIAAICAAVLVTRYIEDDM